MEIGYFLSSEEFGPKELVRQAVLAEEHGFDRLWISDHYHPWMESQGHSPFVWSVIGGIVGATDRLHVTTAVTCPTTRIHPAIVAQAAATSAVMLDGRFTLGVGSGEKLNEHILGDAWPEADVRLERLEEAVEVMRKLWSGEFVSHRGRHYRVANAKIYDVPEEPIEIAMSAFGPKSIDVAVDIADSYAISMPSGDLVDRYQEAGGDGPICGGMKACYGQDEEEAVQTAYDLWRNEALPGELIAELPMPAHYEQATSLLGPEDVAEMIPCGPDPERHADALRDYADAGFDSVCVQQIGGDHEAFFDFYRDEVIPRL